MAYIILNRSRLKYNYQYLDKLFKEIKFNGEL